MKMQEKMNLVIEDHAAHCYCAGPTCSGCEENTGKLISIGFRAALSLPEVQELVSAASKLGLQCVNTGNYGPLNISPGQCTCSTCEMKKALTKWREFVGEEK